MPILHVLGRQHPVNIRHVTKSQDDWQSAILATVFQIHGRGKNSYIGRRITITVFLPLIQSCHHLESIIHL